MGEKYDLDRNDQGLTATERGVLAQLEKKMTLPEIADANGWSRQRAYKVRAQLKSKGALNG